MRFIDLVRARESCREYTDRPVKFIATEVIREKALLYLQQEIPHGIAIELVYYPPYQDN